MSKTFTYSAFDIGNSAIVPDQEGSPTFTITTNRGTLDTPKLTTLTSSVNNAVVGSIDWKKKTMEVKGTTKPYAELKTKQGGALSLSHEWKWSTKKYLTTFKKGSWTAASGNETVAVFTNVKYHPFGKAELATFNFPSEPTEEEMVFLMLALLFSDLKLPPNKTPLTFKAAAGGAATDLAVTVAGNAASAAVSNCCVVQ